MALKKGSAPKTLPAKLELIGGGEKTTLNLTFYNRKPSEITAHEKETRQTDKPFLAEMVFYLIKEWDTDYSLSIEGIVELEDERPGICEAILQGFWQVRKVNLQGN